MKKVFFLLLSIVLMESCSNYEELEQLNPKVSSTNSISSHINKDEAAIIAKDFLQNELGTRSNIGNAIHPEFDYVMAKSKTRNFLNLSDTLAYIINFPNNGGFVIVASDKRINPILAFSEKGRFDTTNEIANDNFIAKIEPYMSASIASSDGTTYNPEDFVWDACVDMEPQGSYGLHQFDPYNKYIVQEHPGYPAGCVTVAVANIVTQTKAYLYDYHGMNFSPRGVRNALKKGVNTPNNIKKKIVPGDGYYIPTYTYEEAVDLMAQLMYWLSKDLGIDHREQNGQKQGFGNSNKARGVLQNIGLNVPFQLDSCNLEHIVNYLVNDHAIYMRGTSITVPSHPIGHAWVCDGCVFCYDYNSVPDENGNYKKRDVFLHCDWGWSVSDVGYYDGDILVQYNFLFPTIAGEFQYVTYMPIKSEVPFMPNNIN